MKRIVAPPDAENVPTKRVDENGNVGTVIVKRVSFGGFVAGTLLNSDVWISGETRAERTKSAWLSIGLHEKFEGAEAGSAIDVNDEVHARLMESLDPALFGSAMTAKAFMRAGFWDAIEQAADASGLYDGREKDLAVRCFEAADLT